MMLDTNIFCGFVWSPILSYHQEILEKINQNYLVKCYDVYDFDNNRDSYHKFVLDMYSTDDIDPKKVKNVKLKFLDQYEYKFAYFIFNVLLIIIVLFYVMAYIVYLYVFFFIFYLFVHFYVLIFHFSQS